MRTIQVFQFNELSDSAKEKARDWFRQSDDTDISDDLHSITEFCDHFGVTLKDYSVGAWSSIDYSHNAENSDFRGVKLRNIKRDAMPTGYYMDCVLWEKFHDEFKKTGDAKHAFDQAVYKAFRVVREDLESKQENAYIDEMIELNEYEFTENGRPA